MLLLSSSFGASSYGLGLIFILLVVIIWSLASILVQYLYESLDFNSPFVLTYICTSLFSILLPARLFYEQCHRFYHYRCHEDESNKHDSSSGNGSGETGLPPIIPWSSSPTLVTFSSENDNNNDAEKNSCFEATYNTFCCQGRLRGGRAGQQDNYESIIEEEATNNGDNHQHYICANNENAMNHHSGPYSSKEDNMNKCDNDFNLSQANGDADGVFISRSTTVPAPLLPTEESLPPTAAQMPFSSSHLATTTTSSSTGFLLGHVQHFMIALKIAPIWFVSNYAYNTSLSFTSIASSTVLSSSGSLFTYLFAIIAKEERITIPRMLGVLLCIIGSILTGFSDYHPTAEDDDVAPSFLPLRLRVWGDITGLIAALGYGLYTVLIKKLCPEQHTSVSLIFGYIGLINFVALSPILFTLNYIVHSAVLQHLTLQIFGWICVKGIFDNVLSDYLWARAVQLTSATVATVGLALTVPLAFLSDLTVMGRSSDTVITIPSMLGAIFVLAGFVLVNYHHSSTDLV